MTTAVFVTGDDIAETFTLKRGGAVFYIAPTATVQAKVISPTADIIVVDSVTLNNAATGADWDNSQVVVEISESDWAIADYQGQALLEIEVDDNGKDTFFEDIVIQRGTI